MVKLATEIGEKGAKTCDVETDRSKKSWRRELLLPIVPVAITGAILAIVVAVILNQIWSLNGGHFAYGLDDAYIHLTLARNLGFDGVLGMTPTSPSLYITRAPQQCGALRAFEPYEHPLQCPAPSGVRQTSMPGLNVTCLMLASNIKAIAISIQSLADCETWFGIEGQ
jgi:hypothetical protein